MRKTLLVALLLSGSPLANAATISCDACSIVEMENAALREFLQHPHTQRTRPNYVTNFENGTVRKYVFRDNVTPGFDWETDGYEFWVEQHPAEAQISNLIADLRGTFSSRYVDIGISVDSRSSKL